MTANLRCFSFHSVKGGVGKSTLSTLAAVALAHREPQANVYLVDMDLTGTSLADVLPVEAPRWDGVDSDGILDLLRAPIGFHDRLESKKRMHARRDAHTTGAIGAPFLNDHLLFEPKKWDVENDVLPEAISWRLVQGPENLRVLPSSALPRDLNRALPVIYDEEHAAFLEARLESLLASIVTEERTSYVVFDTPPTIPGLSRSVIDLAFRLSREPKRSLAVDGFVPHALEDAAIQWQTYLVATLDCQDIRAAERWLDLVAPEDQEEVLLFIKPVRVAPEQRDSELRRILDDDGGQGALLMADSPEAMNRLNPYVLDPIWVDEDEWKQNIFREEGAPPSQSSLLESLRIELSWRGE